MTAGKQTWIGYPIAPNITSIFITSHHIARKHTTYVRTYTPRTHWLPSALSLTWQAWNRIKCYFYLLVILLCLSDLTDSVFLDYLILGSHSFFPCLTKRAVYFVSHIGSREYWNCMSNGPYSLYLSVLTVKGTQFKYVLLPRYTVAHWYVLQLLTKTKQN